jgi:drug/metabolite transporter (DMT)-like permease
VAAAVLWSLSGALVKLLHPPAQDPESVPLGDWLGVSEPAVPGLMIAFCRALFAGLFLVPTLRRRDLSFRPLMLAMVLCFAAMNALFVSALALGSAANAILLQYTAPLWLYVAGVLWLKERGNWRSSIALAIAMTGVGFIVVDAVLRPTPDTLRAVVIALGSGLTYAGVIFFLRLLRNAASAWLVVLNQLGAALALLPVVLLFDDWPTWRQLLCLAFFGAVQMGLPYLLMSRGLRTVNVQEAGTITLLEPVLNPIWAYLVAGDVPDTATFIGGALILLALIYRYAPLRRLPGKD